jgi:hypothetical protein
MDSRFKSSEELVKYNNVGEYNFKHVKQLNNLPRNNEFYSLQNQPEISLVRIL